MPITPVITTTWLDPPEQTDFQVGTAVTWHASFMDRQTRAPVTPDIIQFIYSSPPAVTDTTVTPTVDATGSCHYDLQLPSVGKWILTVAPQGNPGAVPIGQASMVIETFDTGQ